MGKKRQHRKAENRVRVYVNLLRLSTKVRKGISGTLGRRKGDNILKTTAGREKEKKKNCRYSSMIKHRGKREKSEETQERRGGSYAPLMTWDY